MLAYVMCQALEKLSVVFLKFFVSGTGFRSVIGCNEFLDTTVVCACFSGHHPCFSAVFV